MNKTKLHLVLMSQCTHRTNERKNETKNETQNYHFDMATFHQRQNIYDIHEMVHVVHLPHDAKLITISTPFRLIIHSLLY